MLIQLVFKSFLLNSPIETIILGTSSEQLKSWYLFIYTLNFCSILLSCKDFLHNNYLYQGIFWYLRASRSKFTPCVQPTIRDKGIISVHAWIKILKLKKIFILLFHFTFWQTGILIQLVFKSFLLNSPIETIILGTSSEQLKSWYLFIYTLLNC